MNLVEATGLKPDEFAKMQKAIVTLRGNLIRSTDE
jgi:MarR family transcriptional regulator, organic hydroperoxide resistance regulator